MSANERSSALFHLVSLGRELASPKTDTVRGTERGKEGRNEVKNKCDRQRRGGRRGGGDRLTRRSTNTNSASLTHMLRHIDEEESSEVAMCETALNRSLMDSQDERPATPHTGGRREEGVGGHRSQGRRSLPPLHTHTHLPFCFCSAA